MNIIIIGAGIGGLSSAALLSRQGHEVTVFERNERVGGKLNERQAGGYRFDTGPSLLTMPGILKQLFESSGSRLQDHLELIPLDPLCRYEYADTTIFNCYHKLENTLNEIRRIAPQDVEAYREFLQYSKQLYERTADAFIFNPLADFRDLTSLNYPDLLRIDAFKTVSDRIDDYFSSAYMRQFFKRFTTYNGSSPFQAPATLNVIPHVELSLGGYYVKGGMYRLAEALKSLAAKSGANFHLDSPVQSISVDRQTKRADGIIAPDGTYHPADLVIANSDAHETYIRLLPDDMIPNRVQHKMDRLEPSCSGFVLLLGISTQFEQLSHHNIFFSDDYRKEFKDIFGNKQLPGDPTIYLANSSYTDPDHAPEGHSNLFILVNAPYLTEKQDWDTLSESYANFLIDELEKRGLANLRDHIEYQTVITPKDFYQRYRSNRGSIYGTSSNSRLAAFRRPANRSPYIKNLYLVGGSTHPGGGIPLVVQSAFHAAELIRRDFDR